MITVLEGRTQAVIRNHFLRYDRAVRCQVKIITMDMFSPYYDGKEKSPNPSYHQPKNCSKVN
nr:transposase [Streptococcus pneumoniae]